MEQSQELVQITAEQQIAAAFGMDESNESTVTKPSRLSLVQTNNADPENGKFAGKFLDEDLKYQYVSLNLIPLRPVQSGRVFFESEELGSKPKCRSNDGIVPVQGEGLFPQAKTCKTCPKSQFRKIGGKPIKTPCAVTASLLAMDTLTGIPYRYGGKRGGATEIKKVWENILKTIQIMKAQGKKMNPLNFQVKLSAVKKSAPKGAYYVNDFGPVVPTEPHNTAKAFSLLQALAASNAVDEEEFTPDAADDAVRHAVSGGTTEHAPEYAEA